MIPPNFVYIYNCAICGRRTLTLMQQMGEQPETICPDCKAAIDSANAYVEKNGLQLRGEPGLHLLDVVETRDGRVGTVVEVLSDSEVLVEFADNEGRTIVVKVLRNENLQRKQK